MSTHGQFNVKNPTIKRILREAAELSSCPLSSIHAAPLESNIFEWHFTIRGPPPPSAFSEGVYHGRIVLPPSYPLRPPSFRFLTPSGRFEVNREICLSISGHHEESWQPAWGIRTALVAIRSFMDTEAKGQLGGVDTSDAVRKRLATDSKNWQCQVCTAGTNKEIMSALDIECAEATTTTTTKEQEVPHELTLGYKDEMFTDTDKSSTLSQSPSHPPSSSSPIRTTLSSSSTTKTTAVVAVGDRAPAATLTASDRPRPPTEVDKRLRPQPLISNTGIQRRSQTGQVRSVQRSRQGSDPKWLDLAIVGIGAALVLMIVRKVVGLFLFN